MVHNNQKVFTMQPISLNLKIILFIILHSNYKYIYFIK